MPVCQSNHEYNQSETRQQLAADVQFLYGIILHITNAEKSSLSGIYE
jgi:hypothetical protein